MKENNQILHRMRRDQKRAFMFRVIYWVIILSFAYGAYFYIEPYVQKFITLYSSSNQSLQKFVFRRLVKLMPFSTIVQRR